MQQISRYIYSRYSKKDLEALLLNYENKKQVVLTDLDGTLHRGLWERGASYFDLAALVAVQYWKQPKEALDFVKRCYCLYDFYKCNKGMLPKDIIETKLVKRFCDFVLGGVSESYVHKATRFLPFFAYKKAKESLLKIGKSADITIISKALCDVLLAYKRWFLKRGKQIAIFGNGLKTEHGVVSEGTYSILTRQDKKLFATYSLLGSERALIFGDSEDDIGMSYAAEELGIQHIMVAVNPNSKELEQRADVLIYSWKELYDVLLT